MLENRQLLEIIRTQSDITSLGPDLGEIMDLVANRTLLLTDARGSAIELAEGEDMVYRAAAGSAKPQLGLRLKRTNSLSGLCVRTGKILRCDDAETDERVDREASRRIGVRSMLLVPLKHHGEVIGALKVMSDDIAAFDDSDAELLGLLSDQVAAAMYFATQLGADELLHRATHDPLTDIPNRALFFDRLRRGLQHARRYDDNLGVLLIDLNDFKPINDGFGHAAGDDALREVAARIRSGVRDTDTTARLGGDEFAVLTQPVAGTTTIERLSERIAREIARPYYIHAKKMPLRASIGHALYPEDATEQGALLATADRRMYENKRSYKAARA